MTKYREEEQKCVHKKVEMDRKKTLKSCNIKHFKLTVHYFVEKVINKNENIPCFWKSMHIIKNK
jgi:hypothetical protein